MNETKAEKAEQTVNKTQTIIYAMLIDYLATAAPQV